jgi:hypothetical protein
MLSLLYQLLIMDEWKDVWQGEEPERSEKNLL